MLILKSLTFSGIGRFVEEQTIDFTRLGSLIQVDGQNLNTGGSSGAGKSTIFKALEFLLGLNDLSNTVLQSRLTKEPMSVTGLLELDGQPLRIQRNKKLLIELNGEVTTGSSKLTEEKLDQIIGMPRDLFRKILHKRQSEGGFFLDMGPSDVHKFLTNCLGLQLEQAKILKLDEILSTLTENELLIKSTIQSNQTGLEATQNAISSLGPPPTLEIDPEAIEGLKIKHTEAINNHKLIQDSHKREISDLEMDRPLIKTIPFDRSNIERLENEVGMILAQVSDLERSEVNRQSNVKAKISELQIAISNLNSSEIKRQSDIKSQISVINHEIVRLGNVEERRRAEVQSSLTSNTLTILTTKSTSGEGGKAKEAAMVLAEELKKIRLSICPTCEQGWINDSIKAKESEILLKLQEYKKQVIAGMAADRDLVSLDEKRKQLLLDFEPRQISESDSLFGQIRELEVSSKPKTIPELDTINAQIVQLGQEVQPQIVPEVLELKLKADFKNKEILIIRQEEHDHQFKESAKSQAILAEFAQKQTSLRQSHETHIQFARENEGRTLSELESAKSKLSSFEVAKKRFDDTLYQLEGRAFLYQDQLSRKGIDLAKVQEEIELATEAKKAIKSYLSASFEDALDSIGDQATKLIRAIPNMSTATIQFEGRKETKEGKVKEEVTCLISMDGEIGIPVKSLSGGERSSTDLSIDLAVIKFIEERTGKGIDLMILDEPFTGLDTTNVFEALEMLKECSVDRKSTRLNSS